jgi:hypothetical protein
MTHEACATLPPNREPLSLQQVRVRQFILHFCKTFNLEVSNEADGSLLIHFGAELAESLGVASTKRLCFSQELINSDAEYVTLGHPLLDRLLSLARMRGKTTSILFTFSLDPTFLQLAVSYNPTLPLPGDAPHAYRRLWTTMGRLRFVNVKGRIVHARALNQLQVLFYFRVSLISDERQELLIPVLIDPTTETPTYWVELDDAVSFIAPAHTQHQRQGTTSIKEKKPVHDEPMDLAYFIKEGQTVLPNEPYTLLRLYRLATAYLERHLQGELLTFAADATQRLMQERGRLEEYYAGLTQEILDPLRKVFRRMASLSVRSQLTHSSKTQMEYVEQMRAMKLEANHLESQYAEELEQLAAEKELRLRELDLKYTSRVELHLVSVAAVHVPRIEYAFRISGKQRREITLFYDVLHDHVIDLSCEVCNQALQDIALCSCGNLVCLSCSNECSCGRVVCTNCHDSACHVCGRLVCESCVITCPLSNHSHLEVPVCAACRQQYCIECMAMIGNTFDL